jgi:N-acetylneuraminic acid mutarotase
MGGQNTDGFRSDVHVYDSQQPGLGWLSVSSLPAPLFRMASAVVNDKIYVVGGGATNGTQSAVYEYDPLQPVQGWRHLNDLPSPRENLAVAALDGKLYSIGGSINSTICSTVFVCDPSRPEQGWLSISNLPAARYVLAAVGLNGKLFAVGGFDGSQTGINTVYMYDPFRPTQGWLSVSSLPAVKGEAPCVSVNGKMYVISGASSPVTYQSSVFEGTFSSGVSPSAGSINGGTAVTITGSNLGDGSDITNVTLCGVVAGIVSQSSSQLVVNSARSDLATNGAVAVYSISGGVTVASNAFSYVAGSGDVSTVGLVGYYALDGNVMDSSGHGYDGSVFSAVPVDGGKRGGCYEFDGKANAIVVYNTALKNEFPAGSPITISAWVRVRAYHSDHTVIAAMDSGRWIQTRASIRLNEYGVPYYYGQTDFPPPLLSTLGPLRPTNGTSSRAFRAARLRACTSMDSWRWRV